MLSPVGRFIFAVVDLTIVAAIIPQVMDSVSFDRANDVLFYLCAVAVAGGGGHLVSQITGRNLEKSREIWNTVDTEEEERGEIIGREFLSAWLRAGVTLAFSAAIACLFLIPLQPPPLANVTFSGAVTCEAQLISHSQGYWYIIKNGDRSVSAIPDSTAGTVNISRP